MIEQCNINELQIPLLVYTRGKTPVQVSADLSSRVPRPGHQPRLLGHKQIISRHWLEDLYTKTEAYSSLKYIEPRLELPQQVWRTGRNDALSTKQAIVKARLLKGTYRLQGNRSVFNQHANKATCQLCGLGDENRLHFVVQCRALQATRAPYLEALLRHLGTGIADDELLLCVILDPGSHVHRLPAANQDADMRYLETLTQRLTYKLHCKRHQLYLNF